MAADPKEKTLKSEAPAIAGDRREASESPRSLVSLLRFRLGQTTRQTSMLFSAQGGAMFFGLLASLILGRMEPAEMGRFAFCLTVVVVLSVFFEFGVSSAGARVLAAAHDRESERQALGAVLVITLAIAVVFTVFLIAAATPLDWIFKKDVRWLLIAISAIAFFQPFQLFIEQGCQGLNQIRRLSEFHLLTSGCYLAALAAMAAANRLTAGTALTAYFAGIAVASIWTLALMRPSFKGVSHYVKLTINETRSYGLNIYVARLSGMASSRSDQLAIAYFSTGSAPLGMYAIAQKFSNPLAMLGSSLATTRFREFGRLSSVPRQITRWSAGLLITASVALVAIGPFVLRLVFPKYADATPLLVPFAVMNLFVGLFQPYNIFLAAHGRGAELRNIVLVVGAASVVALVATVPRFGLAGAAWTAAAGMALDYVLHLYYYRKFKRTITEAVERRGQERSSAGVDVSTEADRLNRAAARLSSQKPVAVLLDLSGDERGSIEWATREMPGSQIQSIGKTDVKWRTKRKALDIVRRLKPDVFAVFTSDLKMQSARSAMTLFGALAGARVIVFGDGNGRVIRCSRTSAFAMHAPRLALELLFGYLVIVPLSWLLTEALSLALVFKGAVTASRSSRAGDAHTSLAALYVKATPGGNSQAGSAGGMATHVTGFISGALALGHRLKLLTSSDAGRARERIEVDLISPSRSVGPTRALFEIWNNLGFTARSLRHMPVIDAQAGIDFIYQRYNRFNWTGVVLSSVTGLPLALEFNGSEVWLSQNWDPVGLRWLLRRFEQLNLKAADHIFVVSEIERGTLLAGGVASDRIVVNPNGVDVDRFKPNCGGADTRAALGISDKIVVGFLGTFGPWHGAPVLAEAARQIGASTRCHFLFIGDGEQRSTVEKIIDSAAGKVSATFVGRLAHAEVPAYLDACDIFAAPNVPAADGSEFFGSPTKLFEYMSMARPVVASRLGQIADIIEDGLNGLLVEPGEAEALARAIEKLAIDEELRARLGPAARQTVIERYTWRHNAARVFDAMRAVVYYEDR